MIGFAVSMQTSIIAFPSLWTLEFTKSFTVELCAVLAYVNRKYLVCWAEWEFPPA